MVCAEFTQRNARRAISIFAARFSAVQFSGLPWSQRAELDCLIYNDPLDYVDLILNGAPEKYLKNVAGSRRLEI